MKIFNVVEDSLIVFGITISIPLIESILGIVILAFQIIMISVRGILKIYKKIKEGKMDEAIEEANKTVDDIKEISGK